MNKLYYIVFDFETYGLSPKTSEAIQVAGIAYDPRTLEPVPKEDGGQYESMMRPLYPERLDEPGARKALSVNKKTKQQCLDAPDQKLVWRDFVNWVGKFNTTKNFMGAPIACGKNIRNFDMGYVEVLNRLHGPKKEETLLFNKRQQIELEDQVFQWFENSDELENIKMDTLRKYFGMATEGAHDALVDCRQTGALIMRFLKLQRELRSRKLKDGSPLLKFENAFAGTGL